MSRIGQFAAIGGPTAASIRTLGPGGQPSRTLEQRLNDRAAFSLLELDPTLTGDGSSEIAKIQAAIDQIMVEYPQGVEITFPMPQNFWGIDLPIKFHDNLILRGSGPGCWIENIRETSSQTGDQHVFYMGTFHPTVIDESTWHLCDPGLASERHITTTTASHAGNYSVGEKVIVASEEYNGSPHHLSDYLLLTWVTAVNATTGRVDVFHALMEDVTNLRITSIDNSTQTNSNDFGYGFFVNRNAVFKGFSCKSAQRIFARGGAINCIVDLHDVISQEGIFGSGMSHCIWHYDKIYFDRKGGDLAGWQACDISVGQMINTGTETDSEVPILTSSQGSRDNKVQIDYINSGTFQGVGKDFFKFNQTKRMHFSANEVHAPNWQGDFLVFSAAATTPNIAHVVDNIVEFGNVYGGAPVTRWITFEGDSAGHYPCRRNTVRRGNFFGGHSDTDAVRVEGFENKIGAECFFENGQLGLTNCVSPVLFGPTFEGGLRMFVTGTSATSKPQVKRPQSYEVYDEIIDCSGGDGNQQIIAALDVSASYLVSIEVTEGFDGDTTTAVEVGVSNNNGTYNAAASAAALGFILVPPINNVSTALHVSWDNNASATAGEIRVRVTKVENTA